MRKIKMAALIVKDPELIRELRRVRSMGRPLSTWEREVLDEAERTRDETTVNRPTQRPRHR